MSEMINSPYVLLLVGLAILVFGGEILVRYASGLAIKAKVTPLIVGLTVVAIGTSSPELFAGLDSSWRGPPLCLLSLFAKRAPPSSGGTRPRLLEMDHPSSSSIATEG